MSKIGKKSIILPKDTTVKVEGDKLTINGPKGSKILFISEKVFVTKINDIIRIPLAKFSFPLLIPKKNNGKLTSAPKLISPPIFFCL